MKHSKITIIPTNDVSFDLLPTYMWSRIDWEYMGEALLLKRRPDSSFDIFLDLMKHSRIQIIRDDVVLGKDACACMWERIGVYPKILLLERKIDYN